MYSCGADPLVCAGPPGPACLGAELLCQKESPARGPAADEGVRPTMRCAQAVSGQQSALDQRQVTRGMKSSRLAKNIEGQ